MNEWGRKLMQLKVKCLYSGRIRMIGEEVEVNKYKYLGVLISAGGGMEKDAKEGMVGTGSCMRRLSYNIICNIWL